MGRQERRTLQQLFDESTARIQRLEPPDALAAMRNGALLVDIRSERARERDGVVPGALHIPRTVLEWRLDPDSEWRSPYAGALERQVVVLCDHGHSSVLAAATLVDLGFEHAGDVIGGFASWCEAGLPVGTAAPPPDDVRPGMGPPD